MERINRFTCKMCNEGFYYKTNYVNHLKKEQGIKLYPLPKEVKDVKQGL